MARKHRFTALAKVKAAVARRRARGDGHAAASGSLPAMLTSLRRRLRPLLRRPWVRRSLIGAGAVVAVIGLVFGGLWWRLGSGPIAFDMATPWLASAIEDNFGENYKVRVGGTQIERDGGRIRLRLLDIAVHDAEGAVAASAPKAEVGFSGKALMAGRVRAERLALVGAEMSVRIDQGGQVSVFAGSDKRPIATASVPAVLADPSRDTEPAGTPADDAPGKSGVENFTALLAWVDSLSKTGLDGHDLIELGLKSGNLTVDDERNGKRWKFENIDLSLMRPRSGSVIFRLQSAHEEQPWSLSATVALARGGHRQFSLDARRVLAKDLLLALRLDEPIMANVPLSATMRADIGPDGTPQMLQGRIIAEAGFLTESTGPSALAIDRAEFNIEWNAARRVLAVPFQIVSGGNRITLYAQVQPPRTRNGMWNVMMSGGTVALGMDKPGDPLTFSTIRLRARFDPAQRKLTLEQGDMLNADISLLVSGEADFSSGDPFLKLQLVASSMQLDAMKKLWPAFVNAPVRNWVDDHVMRANIDRITIATNAHLSAFRRGGPPVPDNGLSIDIVAHNATLRPLETLPPIENAELALRVVGRRATVDMSRGTAVLASGRRLAIADGRFEVPDCEVPSPPSKTSLRIEGPVPVAAELLESERLREFVNMPFDISSAKGNVFARASLAFPMKRDLPPGSSSYSVTADIANFSADKMILGQKVEAQSLRINASNQGYEIKGDTKIAGAAAALNYGKAKDDEDAKVSIQTTLDDAARARLGFEGGNTVAGPVGMKVIGYLGPHEGDSRFVVEADLTQARVENLLPGWSKAGGKAARAKFSLTARGKAMRVEDLAIEGAGTRIKGGFELDGAGDVVAANFSEFNLSEGDRGGRLRAERAPDGALRVVMRGDVHDGRAFIKSAVSGGRPDARQKPPIDIDLDLDLGTVAGSYGETLRNLKLKFTRRGGQIRSFAMNGKLGRDALLTGDLRLKRNGAGNVLYLESRDAGAFFKFTGSYANMVGGRLQVAVDAPVGNAVDQEGEIWISNFSIRGEGGLDRVSGVQPGSGNGVRFDRAKAEFTRSPGRLEIRDGVVHGNIGATIEGQINYAADQVRLRGSFIPMSPLNNIPGQIPIVGLFLGGGNEGLVGVTYEVVGPTTAPRLNVNPLSTLAPGIFRKLFEFRDAPTQDRSYEPVR